MDNDDIHLTLTVLPKTTLEFEHHEDINTSSHLMCAIRQRNLILDTNITKFLICKGNECVF